MPAILTSAPGKIILFGEHAVVYGRPAIAVPVTQVQAQALAVATPRAPLGEVRIQAPDIGLDARLDELAPRHPLRLAVSGVCETLHIQRLPAFQLRVTSSIPLSSGMGSGAAVAVAVIRATSEFLGTKLTDEVVSDLAFEVEKVHHGTPSGIDNTVIATGRPVYFQKAPEAEGGLGSRIEPITVAAPFVLVIGISSERSQTLQVVGAVRQAWQANERHYEALFDQVAALSQAARGCIEAGRPEEMGALMDENQQYLKAIGVSSQGLEALILAAKKSGALGAKLSGAGRGGNMIALVKPEQAPAVAAALAEAGARQTIVTEIRGKN